MSIKWTGYDNIKLDNGVTISVSSETPGSTSAHSKVVDAIIKAVGKIEGSDKPPYDAIAGTGEAICDGAIEANPKLGEPAGNPPASLGESKPKLLIDIAKSTDSSERAMKVISLTFRHLYEAFDRDEERAMAFVACIASTKFDDVLMIPMSNDQVIMAEALACRQVGHDKLVELAKQAIARVATAVAINYVVSVR